MSDEMIIKTEYSELMQRSFIDYSMSVIVSRAIPDVRDGLKPVQRRVLYDMSTLHLSSDQPYRKCARIVGDTMGKYHPHGDSSIYDSLVVMSQDFKKGAPLVDGHGNFGNIEGDGAAAMRYTEARLQKITEETFLRDLDKDTVDFVPNFDETEKEPSVLPVRIPNILINGSEGIAVGMTTSIAPHNITEVIDAEKAFIDNPEITTKELMRYIKGPDFPTGGIVCNKDELENVYETGSGKIRVRGKVETEKGKNGHTNLVVTEIPYTMIGAGIAKFLSDVASLAEEKKTTDIVDISNQSSKEGIRIVIELKKDADVENFKNLLYKKTRLEDTFPVSALVINKNRPETMSLREIIKANVDFQYELCTRKYTTLLNQEMEKKEIQEGLIKACNVIDLVVEIIMGSPDRKTAFDCLTTGETEEVKFKSRESKVMASQLLFSEKQANAILDLRLYRLCGLEVNKLIKDHEETMSNIYRYEDILERRDSMSQVIEADLNEYRKKFGKQRKTEITNAEVAVYEEKPLPETDVYCVVDRFGYVRTVDENVYIKNTEALESENRFVFCCRSNGKVCVFTSAGKLYTVKVADLPNTKLKDKGIPIDNISDFDSRTERIIYVTSQMNLNLYRFIFVTKLGQIKSVSGGEFDVTRRSIAATKMSDEDELISVDTSYELEDVVLRSKDGFFLRFPVTDIPEQKKNAAGARGIHLPDWDYVSEVYYIRAGVPAVIDVDGTETDLRTLKQSARGRGGRKLKDRKK
ncbi:MAG: DNA topoisomerase 4 subunit A [Lachnospiraceae bacterium]|nr:DNA topoisomerase 4 subunit A [Lachnospiraceae bacterium]